MRAVRWEFLKMHRLHMGPIAVVMAAAVVALASMNLFSASTRATFSDPARNPWATLLLNFTMMSAMTSPILVSVLASRQTDIEHSGSGWILAGTAGEGRGRLCRAKVAALAVVMVLVVVIEAGALIGAGRLAGITRPVEAGPWAQYCALLILVDIAFLALHVWLAALVENQLVSVGVGMLGAFLAVFCLLMPGAVVRLVPWGYYAVISVVEQSGSGVAVVRPSLGWIAGFLIVVGVAFWWGTRRLDRLEK